MLKEGPETDSNGQAAEVTEDSSSLREGAPPTRPLSELERAIGYSFTDSDLLRRALVHKSFLHDVPNFPLGSNERLEFLGDAVLGFIVSSELFIAHPETDEGQLTAWRGVLVRLSTLAEVAEPLRLGEYLYMSRGEEAAGGRERRTNMGRAVEALLGAVYMDGGLHAVRDVWHRILGERSVEQLQQVLSSDYKSQLQKFTQAHLKVTPSYRIVGASGPDHAKHFSVQVLAGDRVLATGAGRNKQIAEQAAAAEALTMLHNELAELIEEPEPEGTADV